MGKSKLFSNYKELYGFIERQYYQNPMYSLGNTVFLAEEFRQYITLWQAWYSGYVDEFHKYRYYNGKDEVETKRRSMRMAKKVCEDKADLMINEKLVITVADKAGQSLIDEVFENVCFREQANELVEKMNALGTGSFLAFLDKGETNIDFVQTQNTIPITIRYGRVTDCAFASTVRVMDEECVYLSTHIRLYPVDASTSEETINARREAGIADSYNGYVIENKLLKIGDGGKYDEVNINDAYGNMETLIQTNTTIPYFQVMTPAKANNLTLKDMGLGLSCYSDAIQQLEGVDIAYDSYVNEFESGKSRMFVHDSLAQIDVSTEGDEEVLKPIFDKRESVFYAVDMGENANEKIQHVQPELRIEAHDQGLNALLNIFGFMCGMGTNYYKFENGVLKTATEIISSNNPLYKSIKKDQHVIRRGIKGIVRAILHLNNINPDVVIEVDFDDSIFEDKAAKSKTAMLEYNAEIIDKVQYFMDVYGMDETTAIEKVDNIEARMPEEENVSLVNGGE